MGGGGARAQGHRGLPRERGTSPDRGGRGAALRPEACGGRAERRRGGDHTDSNDNNDDDDATTTTTIIIIIIITTTNNKYCDDI